MNILEAFDNALPEIPAKSSRKTYLRLDPRLIAKEHLEHGVPTIFAKMPGCENYVRFTRPQWMLLELFNGERDFDEIAELIKDRGDLPFSAEDVKEFATFLRDKTDFFYRSPLEKSITLKQKLGTHRHKRKRLTFSDFTEITLYRWPHADDYLTKLQPYVRWLYAPWCVYVQMILFLLMAGMWAGKIGEIWRDSFQFYNFSGKSAWDLVEFWFLFGAMAFFHETAHGMTCKEYGGRVERIEFLLMYFSPTFMCDVTQIWILGGRKARLATIIAGIWFDLVICFVATTLWWATPTGMLAHDFAYKVMMVTGIGVTLLNLNPLIKLDGYYLFSELVGEADLLEASTSYLSQWFKRHVLQLPVEVEFVPRNRRALYMIYAFCSQGYGTMLMVLVAFFFYHILRSYNPEYAWIPGFAIGFYLFRKRLRDLGRLMKEAYLDKRDRIRGWFTPLRAITIAAVALVAFFSPIWPSFVQGRFILEPAKRAVVRAQVAGIVSQVYAAENQQVRSGSSLVQLKNSALDSEAAQANADLRESSARALRAGLLYSDYGKSDRERQAFEQKNHALVENLSHLQIVSPIDGVVVSPKLEALLGTRVEPGATIVEVAQLDTMRALIYIPEFRVRQVGVGNQVRLRVDSRLSPLSTTVSSISPLSSPGDPALLETEQLAGIVPPPFYVASATVANGDRKLHEGMSGTAKLFIGFRSPAEIIGRFSKELLERRFW